jgi:hypothetical protein
MTSSGSGGKPVLSSGDISQLYPDTLVALSLATQTRSTLRVVSGSAARFENQIEGVS